MDEKQAAEPNSQGAGAAPSSPMPFNLVEFQKDVMAENVKPLAETLEKITEAAIAKGFEPDQARRAVAWFLVNYGLGYLKTAGQMDQVMYVAMVPNNMTEVKG